MNYQNLIQIMKKRKWLIFWLMLFGAVVAFDVSVIQTPQYKSSARVLVVQNQTQGQDIYTISKSAQYLTRVLKEGVYSDSFFDQLLSSSAKIERSDFPPTAKERHKDWENNVKIVISQDLGVMEINVFSPDETKIADINQAVVDVLVNNHQFYHGGGSNVEVKILDWPVVSQQPVKPNLAANTIVGAIVGFLVGLYFAIRRKTKKEISPRDGSRFSISRGGF